MYSCTCKPPSSPLLPPPPSSPPPPLHTVVSVKFGQIDYRVREGANDNLVRIEVARTWEKLAVPLTLKVTPSVLMGQEAQLLDIPLGIAPASGQWKMS